MTSSPIPLPARPQDLGQAQEAPRLETPSKGVPGAAQPPASKALVSRTSSSGNARTASAAQKPPLPTADRRAANAARLDSEMAQIMALRPQLGESGYAVTKAANVYNRLQAGLISPNEALSALNECRSLIPGGEAGCDTIDALEREALSSPARELAVMASEAENPESATVFQSLAAKLKNAMDSLRLDADLKNVKATFQSLKEAQSAVLFQDSLFEGLPPQTANKARAALSETFQNLLQAANERIGLSSKTASIAPKIAMANAMARGAEMASSSSFDPAAFKTLLLSAAETLEGGRYRLDLEAALNQDPLTDRSALNLLHDLKGRLAADGVMDPGLPETASDLRSEAVMAQKSQFTKIGANPGLLELIPARSETGPFLERALDAGMRLAVNPSDLEAQEDLRLLANDMELFDMSLSDLRLDQSALDAAAALRSGMADWAKGSHDTDDLAALARDASMKLPTLPEGPEKRLLTAEIATFESFRLSAEEEISRELEGRLGEARDLLDKPLGEGLSGGNVGQSVEDLEARLDGALHRLQGDPKAGTALKADEAARTSEAKNLLELRLLAERQEALKSPRAGVGTLEGLVERHGATPEGREMIASFSKDRAAELTREIASLTVPESSFPGEAIKAQAAGIERRIARLLLNEDTPAVKAALAEKMAELRGLMAEKAMAALDPAISGQLSESERQGLKTIFSHCGGAESLVALANADPQGKGLSLVKGLAALANAPVAEIPGRIDELLLDQPRFDDIALELKLGLVPEGDHESVSASHLDARLQRQTLALIREGGGQDLLDALGAQKPGDLNFKSLVRLLGHAMARPGGAPAYEAGAFNTLLVQAAWSRFCQEGNLSGSDADLLAFRDSLPEPLSGSSPGVLKGMFALGPLSGSDMRMAGKMAAQASKLLASRQVGLLMDRMADRDPALKAQRALTAMLRNMLVSASIEFDPRDDNAGAYAKALQAALPIRAKEASITNLVNDSLKRALNIISETSKLSYDEQVASALSQASALTGPMDRIRSLQADLAIAMGELQKAAESLSPSEEDWEKLNFDRSLNLPKEEFPEQRLAMLADPFRFLRYQNALDLDNKIVIGSKIQGEPFALTVLTLKDTLSGAVAGLGTPAERLEALRSLDFPKTVNFKRMLANSTLHHPEPEAKAFMANVAKLKALNPLAKGFEADFAQLSDQILADIEKYNLARKSLILLAHKDTREGLRIRGSSGATLASRAQDVTTFGDSPADAAMALAADLLAGDVRGVKSSDATRHGLSKIDHAKPPLTGPSKAIRHHILTGSMMTVRGSGANLNQAMTLSNQDARARIVQKSAVLSEALADLSSRTAQVLKEAVRMSALGTFVSMDFHDFAEAEAALRPDSGRPLFRAEIEKKLKSDFGIEPDLASFLVEAYLIQPLAIEAASRPTGDDSPGLLERFCSEAVPSERVDNLGRRIDSELAAPVRQLVQSETGRRRFATILDQLNPGTAIDFSAGTSVSAGLGVEIGGGGASLAASLALEKGISLGRNADGAFELAIRGDFQGGIGVGASVLAGAVEASLGLAADSSEALNLTFKSKDDAAAFLQKLNDGVFSPEDLPLHCQNVNIQKKSGVGIAIKAKAELGEVKVTDNFPIGAQVFSLGFEASGNLSRQTETDANAQTITTTTSLRGRIGVSLTVATAEEEEDDDGSVRIADGETPDFGTGDAMEAASATGLEVGDDTIAILGKGVVVSAGISRDDEEGLTVEASVTASRTSTMIRSTKSGMRGRLVGASQNISVEFTGKHSITQFTSYAERNLGFSSSLVATMRRDIEANNGPFTLEAERSLKPEVAEKCRLLEETNGSKQEIKALLRDDSNYAYSLSPIKLVFQGRQESETGTSVTLNTPLVRFQAKTEASAKEAITIKYEADLASGGPGALESQRPIS